MGLTNVQPKYLEVAGSGPVRVTTSADVRRSMANRDEVVQRTSSDLFQSQVDEFWSTLSGVGFSPSLMEKVWVANRCVQLNSQQISRMPLRFFGRREPAWVANPDPAWYPNGIGDALFAATWSLYTSGDAFVYITYRYEDGYPSAWTVLDPAPVSVDVVAGRRRYRSGQVPLISENMVHIQRDPRGGVRGTSALRSYASQAYGLLAASDLGRVMMAEGATPNAVLKANRKLTPEQAEALQLQWVGRTAVRRGAPAVLPPDVDFEQLSFSPQDLLLLDAQKFNSQVIASAFGVPAMFLNLPIQGGLNYQTPAMLGEHWWRFELRPIAGTIAQALSANMLPRGSFVSFDAKETMAPTFKDLANTWVQMYKEGLVTADELRAVVLQLPPQPAEDALADLTVPPSAGASPAQQPQSVITLRPTSSGG